MIEPTKHLGGDVQLLSLEAVAFRRMTLTARCVDTAGPKAGLAAD